MVDIRLTALTLVLCLAGCTVVPYSTASQACDLLNSATMEGDMVPAWYTAVGPVLESCGFRGAKAWVDEKACAANKYHGYECEAPK